MAYEFIYLTFLQNHHLKCYALAFAVYSQFYYLFLAVLEYLQRIFKLQSSSDIQRIVFKLLPASFLVTSVKAFVHDLGTSFILCSSNLVVYVLLNGILFLNPRLKSKRFELLLFLSAPVEQLFFHKYWDAAATKAIIRLICQDKSAFRLLSYLVDALSGLIRDASGDIDKDLRRDQEEVGDRQHLSEQNVVDLFEERGVRSSYVAAMPYKVRRAILESLEVEGGYSRQLHHPSPICSITLECLVDDAGKVKEDVVAVVEGQGQGQPMGKQHAFLYRGEALYSWLRTLQVPTSPDSRCIVQPMDIYRLSCY